MRTLSHDPLRRISRWRKCNDGGSIQLYSSIKCEASRFRRSAIRDDGTMRRLLAAVLAAAAASTLRELNAAEFLDARLGNAANTRQGRRGLCARGTQADAPPFPARR